MNNSRQIIEALHLQPLSEEEKQSRHILGRLYGPIATCKESTRNGRKYNKELWERQLNDEIFQEKVVNKSLFLELGHPEDREETDMEKVCACIPEMPKIVDGDLYAYVDILDTNNGRLLKTLCDYGFVPGISSRGSGDVMGNDEVDPETFFLETWDIVQLPAVKKARLNVCESLQNNQLTLKKVLCESYKKSDTKAKKLMKETLDKLHINFTEEMNSMEQNEDTNMNNLEDTVELLPGGTPVDPSFIPVDPELTDSSTLLEDKKDDDIEEVSINTAEADEGIDIGPEALEDSEDLDLELTAKPADIETDAQESKAINKMTVGELIDILSVLEDPDMPIEVESVKIDNKDYTAELFVKNIIADDKFIFGVNCSPIEDNSEDIIAETELTDAEAESETDKTDANDTIKEQDKVDDTEAKLELEDTDIDTATDGGDDEVIESLKEAIRQKNTLMQEIKSLKKLNAVGDAKVKTMTEELNKYKAAFNRVSELAGKTTKIEAQNKKLSELLDLKATTIKQLQTQLTEVKQTNQDLKQQSTTLTEQLNLKVVQKEKNLTEQITQYKQKLQERTLLAKQYKNKSKEILEHYIATKASMLGISSKEITSRLHENYSLAEIDKICDDFLVGNLNANTILPYGLTKASAIRVNEEVNRKQPTRFNSDNGYDIDNSLLELAGLSGQDLL